MATLNKLLAILLGASHAFAFPQIAEEWAKQQFDERQSTPKVPFPEWPGLPSHASYNKFNAHAQRHATSGKNRFIPPKEGDIRGPCAGLNAAANHGYIPRNGIATAETINEGLQNAFGLSADLTNFLETATRFFDGNPLTGEWSIGYYSDKVQNLGPAGDLLGNETGICAYGHLKTEGDASITRGDWLAPSKNSNCASYPEYVEELFDLANKMTGGDITPQVLARHQANRKQHSIKTNPYYFSPAYAGVAFTFGAHMFAFQLLSNHSAENPRGILTQDNFLEIWSYKRNKQTGKLEYTYGHERIPDNYYRRGIDDEWTLADVVVSTGQQCLSYPDNCQVGGNTGTTNSFTGVDAANISGGFINSFSELSDPQKAGCFIRQAIQADVPAFLDKAFSPAAVEEILALIPTQLIPALEPLGSCPGLPKGRSQTEYGSAYGGSKKLYKVEGPRKPYPGYPNV